MFDLGLSLRGISLRIGKLKYNQTKVIQIKLKANSFMIEKEILTSKSKYFPALLDGPMAEALESDGSLAIIEEDHEEFKALLSLVRQGKLPPTIRRDGDKVERLQEMASFYLIEHESNFKIFPKLYVYKTSRDSDASFKSICMYASRLKTLHDDGLKASN
jgi:BTB/POZ domain